MATDSVKHVPTLSGAAISTEMKSFFTAVKPTKTIITFVYASFITFVAFTVYLAFTPSLITFVYSVSSYILPNVTAVTSPSNFTTNTTSRAPAPRGSLTPATLKSSAANETNILSIKNASLSRTEHASVHLCPNNNTDKQAPLSVNSSASPMRKQSRTKREIKSLKNCEFFEGEWVKDDSYPLYKPGTCTIIDQQFNCMANGRPDVEFYKLKWKPKECTLPRLDGGKLLEMIRGRRLVFVGDSLNRNMWESLVCILKGSVKDERQVFEAHGRHHFRGEAEYSFVFKVSLQSVSLRPGPVRPTEPKKVWFGLASSVFNFFFIKTNQSFWFQLYFGLKVR